MKQYSILDKMQKTSELKNMSFPVMNELCSDIRNFLVDNVSKTGGHLASNLGIVELSVALERVFNSEIDRIIYDVGHQAYVHKILTGRKDKFTNLRKFGGLSGFMKPDESKTDPCITGHASSSVSVALGMAHARTIKNQKYNVVAVIGDGALTGGMAYEALNNAGASHEPLLVILNDNNMSITKNVGALNMHLSKLRVSPSYLNTKSHVKSALTHVPAGKSISNMLSKTKNKFKKVVLTTSFFEQIGMTYLGPVDGHDLHAVCEFLTLAKSMKQPVLLHVITQKGRGYSPAEQKPQNFHGVTPFSPETGISLSASALNFSSQFGSYLCELAKNDERICAITAAMSSGTGLLGFEEKFPSRFFDVGIAEEHAVAMSAGMAKQGLKPICTLYSTFLQRGYDQIIHDVAIEGLNVIFAIDRAGIVGEDGETHNGVFDVSFLRQIPNISILAPSNFVELKSMLSSAIYKRTGAIAIRYPRGGEGEYIINSSHEPISCIKTGNDFALVSYGIMINEAIKAAEILQEKGINVAVYKINELTNFSQKSFLEEICKISKIAVIEDVIESGGIGEAISCAITASKMHVECIKLLNIGNRFLPCGSVAQLRDMCKIDAKNIAQIVQEEI